jgi:5,10-methylenetetrahydrofolate reductase
MNYCNIVMGPPEHPEIVLGLHAEVDSPSPECEEALKRLKNAIENSIDFFFILLFFSSSISIYFEFV